MKFWKNILRSAEHNDNCLQCDTSCRRESGSGLEGGDITLKELEAGKPASEIQPQSILDNHYLVPISPFNIVGQI